MKLNNIKHIFFDLDHTLWDFDKNSALAFGQIFKNRSIFIETDDFLKIYVSVNLKYWALYRNNDVTKEALRYGRLKESFDLLEFQISDEDINILAEEYINFLPNYNHLLEGSEEILEYLYPKYQLHIITNGFEEVQHRKMINSGILNYFSTITTSEETGVKKPHAVIFEKALQKSKASVDQSIMIGDNFEADILGAQNCGLASIFFDYYQKNELRDCLQVQKLKDLIKYL